MLYPSSFLKLAASYRSLVTILRASAEYHPICTSESSGETTNLLTNVEDIGDGIRIDEAVTDALLCEQHNRVPTPDTDGG